MDTSIDTIKEIFDASYARLGASLPIENLRQRKAGSIDDDSGFMINYRFGQENGVEYLEFFVSHRMTNDTLRRIYADGREEIIGYCREFYLDNNEQDKEAYYEHNRKFYALVREKGLE